MIEKAVVFDALSLIGYHLCEHLLNEGIEVAAVDVLEGSAEKEQRWHMFGRNDLFTLHHAKPEDLALDDVLYDCDTGFQLPRHSVWQDLEIRRLVQVPFWVVTFEDDITSDSEVQKGLQAEKACYRMSSEAGVSAAILRIGPIEGHRRSEADKALPVEDAIKAIYTAALQRISGIFHIEDGSGLLKKDVKIK